MKHNAREQRQSIRDIMDQSGKSREEVLTELHLSQPPITKGEPFRSTKQEVKRAKAEQSIPDGSITKFFSNWSKFRPNWGSFVFNGLRVA